MYQQTNRVSLFTKPVNTKSEEQVPEKYVSLFEAYTGLNKQRQIKIKNPYLFIIVPP